MEHNEAIEMMAAEKYLLDELTPDLRDAYEDHYFGCEECALDVRLGGAFIDHAKTVLPQMMPGMMPGTVAGTIAAMKPAPSHAPAKSAAAKPAKEKFEWFSWLRPAVMVPAFACLLALVAYQNLAVFPALELAASQPRILPAPTVLHDATRGGHPVVLADRVLGSHLSVELPANVNYASYKFDFYNSSDKLLWSQTILSATASDDMVPLFLPAGVKQDTYKLAIAGITPAGESVPLTQRIFDLQIKK